MQFLLKRLALFSVFSMTVFAQDIILSNTNGLAVNIVVVGWSGDYFSELYIPPADGQANSIDFNMADLPDIEGGSMLVAIYAANYPWEEIDEGSIADTSPDSWLGYYEDSDSYNITGENWVLGGINNLDGADSSYHYDPLGVQLWPEAGMVDMPIYPNVNDYSTLTLDLENSEFGPFYFEREEAFIVVVQLAGFEDQSDSSIYRTGFQSGLGSRHPPPA